MTPSPFQQAIYDFIENDSRSLRVDAVAGSGKTTTIVAGAKLLPKHKLSVFLAFNKSTAEELKTRLPYFVQAKTFHSHCFDALKVFAGARGTSLKVDFKKVGKIFETWCGGKTSKFYKHVNAVTKLVGYAKASGVGASPQTTLNEPETWQVFADLVEYFDLDTEDEAYVIANAIQCLKESNLDLTSVDFDDMLYLTLLLNVPFNRADFVFVDEAQDLNGVQRELLKRMVKESAVKCAGYCGFASPHNDLDVCTICGEKKHSHTSGRLIIVGDPHQAIYGFRGADADGMERIAHDFDCVTLPLSVSYRCSQEVVREAQKVLDRVQPKARPTGVLSHVDEVLDLDPSDRQDAFRND